jgi:hypothetical protein
MVMAPAAPRLWVSDEEGKKEGVMKRWTGGTKVGPGFYWRRAAWEIVPVSAPGNVLPGGGEERYVRVPTLAMLALAPAMGGAFAFFLPFIGFAMVARQVARRVTKAWRNRKPTRKAGGERRAA